MWNRSTGDGNYGPWSLQNGEITVQGEKMRVLFANMEPVSDEHQGDAFFVQAQSGKKGIHGVSVKEEDYKGNKRIVLKITKAAKLLLGDAAEAEQPAIPNGSPAESMAQPRQNAPKTDSSGSGDGVKEARHYFMRSANLYDLAYSAAQYLREKHGFETEQVKDVATTLFINACRDGLANKMPDKPLGIKEPPKKEQTEKRDPPAVEADDIPWDNVPGDNEAF